MIEICNYQMRSIVRVTPTPHRELGRQSRRAPTTVSAVCQANENKPISNPGTVDRCWVLNYNSQSPGLTLVPVLFLSFFNACGLFELHLSENYVRRTCSRLGRGRVADTASVSHWAIIIHAENRNRNWRLETGTAPLPLCYADYIMLVSTGL